MTQELVAFRDRLESFMSLYKSQARDREEWVFNGWVTYQQVEKEIKFFRSKVRNCLFLLGLS
jgi:hypothetical protein